MSPVADAIISRMNAATIASDTMPTLSDLRRFHASAHRPGDTVCGTSRTIRAGAFSAVPFAIDAPVI